MKQLLERVRRIVEGQKVLFVSNRTDERLRRKLEKELGIEVDWKDVQQVKAAQTASSRIRNGRYDMVFVATSFISHKSDKLIKGACQESDTRYVPVNKGSAQHVVQGLLPEEDDT